MGIETNKAVVRRFIDEVFVAGRMEAVDELVAHIFRVRGGRITEHWGQADLLGMMRQLGAMPGQD